MTMTATLPLPASLAADGCRITDDIRPEELDRYDDGPLVELVDGRLLEKPVSALSQLVANTVNEALIAWVKPERRGQTFVESFFQCFPDKPKQVRRPDVAFVPAARLAGYAFADAHLTVVPDLIVEVVSPTDDLYDLDDRLADFFGVGTRRAWVINPVRRTLRAFRPDWSCAAFAADDAEVADPEVLPGFSARLGELFPAAPAPAES